MDSVFWRRVLMLALPVALQMLLQSFLGMADVAMVAGLGAETVAAVGLAAKLHFLLLVLMVGIASGGSILIAQYIGARDLAGGQRILAVALWAGAALSTPLVALFALGQHWLVWLNPDQEVIQIATRFLWITAPVIVFTQCIVIYEAALRAMGITLLPLAASATAALVNIALNYILIFGHLGFDAMGAEGAAWGTLVARGLQLFIVLFWLYYRKQAFALGITQLRAGLQVRAIRQFAGFSLPLIINHTIWGVGNSVYHVGMGYSGTHALAVMGVMVPFESAFFALFIGLANASAVMVGNALGADNPSEARRLQRFFERLTLALVLVLSALVLLFGPGLIRRFGALEPMTTELLVNALLFFSVAVWLKILNMVRILGVLRAGGDNRFCLINDCIVMWIFGVPIFVTGVWLGAPFITLYFLTYIEDLLKFFPVLIRIHRGRWIKNLTRDDRTSTKETYG